MIDTYPAQDALANILGESYGNGGAPYNLLLDLARLGAKFPLSAVGLVGQDPDGSRIVRECCDLGIECSQLKQTERAHTSYTDVMTVQSTGRRTFFHQRGANALLGQGDFDFTRSTARIFHLGYLLLLDGLDKVDPDYGTISGRVLAAARSAGLITSIDVVSEDKDRFKEFVRPALPHTDICFMNEFEAERTTGLKIFESGEMGRKALRNAAKRLIEFGIKQVVVIHTMDVVYARTAAGKEFWQGSVKMPQKEIVSVVGAGDAFAAGFLMGYHDGRSIPECLELGVCSAAACLTHASCSEGVRPAEDCLDLGKRYGFREAEQARVNKRSAVKVTPSG